jgi:hypothetical protein
MLAAQTFLSGVADDKHATLMRNVDLPMLAPLVGTLPLQETKEQLRLRFANGLDNRDSVLIPQVGVRTFITERQEKLVVLVDHTAHRNIQHGREEFIVGVRDRCFEVFVKLPRFAAPLDVVLVLTGRATLEPIINLTRVIFLTCV